MKHRETFETKKEPIESANTGIFCYDQMQDK